MSIRNNNAPFVVVRQGDSPGALVAEYHNAAGSCLGTIQFSGNDDDEMLRAFIRFLKALAA
jgi:hypothetical protein